MSVEFDPNELVKAIMPELMASVVVRLAEQAVPAEARPDDWQDRIDTLRADILGRLTKVEPQA